MPAGISRVCNLGCEVDLWPDLGRVLLSRIHRDYPDTALSAWPGKQNELDQWLATGLVDLALTYKPINRDQLSVRELHQDALILVSTRADAPIRFDPGYVYVDSGEEFGRRHAAAYADAGIAKVSFGCSSWALEFLLDRGGSAYLPERIARPFCAAGRLHRLTEAPEFKRSIYLITSDSVASGWPWLDDIGDWLEGQASAPLAVDSSVE